MDSALIRTSSSGISPYSVMRCLLLYSEMSDMMAVQNNNITAFNAKVNGIMQQLHARGKNADDLDLTPQLLATYMACGPHSTDISRGWKTNNDGNILLTTKVLMDKTGVKYEELKDKNKFGSQGTHGLKNIVNDKDSGNDIVTLRA
jgi:hypothetical protein